MNLDPAADTDDYEPGNNNSNSSSVYCLDIRECITVAEVMEEMGLGPNGALLYCMEYFLNSCMEWLQDQLDSQFSEDDYVLMDCPGQLELYTHVPVMPRLIGILQMWGYAVGSVFCVDAPSTLLEASKFVSASLLSLSAMMALELPHVNVMTKCDLVAEGLVDEFLEQGSALEVLERDVYMRRARHYSLTQAIAQVLDDYSMVSFVPLNIQDEDSIDHVLTMLDHVVQYGEDAEVYGANHDEDGDGDEE
jgi:GPN-loop GTPase